MTEIRVERDASSLAPVMTELDRVSLPLMLQIVSLLLKEEAVEYTRAQVGADDFDPAVARYLLRVSKILDTAAKAVETEGNAYLKNKIGHA